MRITITDVTGREIRALDGTKNAGLNRVQWDLRAAPAADEAAVRAEAADKPCRQPKLEHLQHNPRQQRRHRVHLQGVPHQQPRLKAPAVAGAVVGVGAEAAFKDRPSQPEPTS